MGYNLLKHNEEMIAMDASGISLCREVGFDDAMGIADWLEDPEVRMHLNELPGISETIREKALNCRLPSYTPLFSSRGRFFVIRLNGKAIGYANLLQKGPAHEVVIVIGRKDMWGKGYGKNALKRLLSHAFLEIRTDKVLAKIKSRNSRSLNLFKHIGFSECGPCEDTVCLAMDFSGFMKKAA